MNDCVKVRTRSLGMLRVCLGDSSMRLGVPFIAVRQLGVIGGQQGRLFLPSVGWRTGQSGAPPDSPVNHSRTPPNFPESDLFTGVQPGAPDTVRCTTGQSGVPD